MDSVALSALARPGTLALPSNCALLSQGDDSELRVVRLPSGHLIAYGPHGRRILAADPAGHPLHECEWDIGAGGMVRMVRARLRLDWSKWIGIKPRGLINRTVLDLSRKSGWQRLSADDLRELAGRALGVPFDEVKFFYTDDDLVIDAQGRATIRHVKDSLYVLDRATFEAEAKHVRFMACMGAMHWEDIDFLPVVELFQSLLPGTGSAAFELIRGLYDDQNQGHSPRPLRYRGIPPYPSEGAYKLFSAFFAPRSPTDLDPFSIFMDPRRSHEVTWLPVPAPPLRYFDDEQRLCVTVQGGVVQKVTLMDDPAGVSFLNVGPGGLAPGGRSVAVAEGQLVLREGERQRSFLLRAEWNVTRESGTPPSTVSGPDWRAVFEPATPHVEPHEAYAAVLLYPEDDSVIAEAATQPFVAGYLEDQRESAPEFAASLARSDRVLIDGFDGALTACLSLDRPRDYRVLYAHPAFAQKQAQTLWNRLASSNRLSWLPRIRFMRAEEGRHATYQDQYDLMYVWVSFAHWNEPSELSLLAQRVASALKMGGLAFVVGPKELESALRNVGLRLTGIQSVEALPTVGMHRSILPRARVKPGLTLFEVRRG